MFQNFKIKADLKAGRWPFYRCVAWFDALIVIYVDRIDMPWRKAIFVVRQAGSLSFQNMRIQSVGLPVLIFSPLLFFSGRLLFSALNSPMAFGLEFSVFGGKPVVFVFCCWFSLFLRFCFLVVFSESAVFIARALSIFTSGFLLFVFCLLFFVFELIFLPLISYVF